MTLFWLTLAAFGAGFINALAGGGSFLTFPALVLAGVPSVVANASSTVALVPGSLATGFSYRREMRELQNLQLRTWLLVSLLGGALGAYLLLFTSDRTFRHLAPWLLLFATIVFAFGSNLSKALRNRVHIGEALMLGLLFPITIYGGYFGGGMGIMFLAVFRLFGIESIHAMNGMKALLGATLNAVAAAIFIAAGQVSWRPTLVMMAAAIAGGFAGPVMARRLPPQYIRVAVIAVGVLMTAYFFHSV